MAIYKEIPMPYDLAKFWSRHVIDAATGCWVWTGKVQKDGYGRIMRHGSPYQAHRVAYTLTLGPIPEGLTLDHLCRNRTCINPAHLEAVPMSVNYGRTERSWSDGFCINGHEIAVVGTHQSGGRLTCAQCGRDRAARYRARNLAGGAR